LPAATRDELAPLHDFLESHQRHEQRKLVAGLDSERYRRLLADWKSFLERPAELDADGAPNAGRPVLEVASARIHKVYRRVLKRGGRIGDDTPAESLHRLRIDCKKLRYLLEFFRGLYEPATVGRLIKALKKLQDNLGDFNDYEVQQEHLRAFGRRMLEEGEVRAETLMAMGRLVAELEEGQAEERRRFGRRFARFADKGNRRRFRELFAPGQV
jgi:CHAD domain-containing protein